MTNFSRKAVISTIALFAASIVAASAAQAGQSEPVQKSLHSAAKAPAVQSAAKSAADGHGGPAAWSYGGAGGLNRAAIGAKAHPVRPVNNRLVLAPR